MVLSAGRRLLLKRTVVLLCGSLIGCGPPPGLVERVAERNPEVLFHVDTADPVVALTIDDGPHPELSPRILDLLAEHDAHATFFLMGARVPGNEGVVRRMVREGHELGNHMMTATPSILLSPEAFARRMRQADSLLAPYGEVRWLRPASAWFDDRMLRQIEAAGYRCALGSVYPNDAQNPFSSYHVRYILRHVRPGAVIILHEGTRRRERILQTLGRVLPELRRRGYRVVTLSELAAHEQAAR